MEPLSIEERDLAEKYYYLMQDKLRGFIRKFPRFRDEFSSATNEALVNGVKRYKKKIAQICNTYESVINARLKRSREKLKNVEINWR